MGEWPQQRGDLGGAPWPQMQQLEEDTAVPQGGAQRVEQCGTQNGKFIAAAEVDAELGWDETLGSSLWMETWFNYYYTSLLVEEKEPDCSFQMCSLPPSLGLHQTHIKHLRGTSD